MIDRIALAGRIKQCVGVLYSENVKRFEGWPKYYQWVIYNKGNGNIKIGRHKGGKILAVLAIDRDSRMHDDYKIKY